MNQWRPIEEYFKEKGKHDWALVQFKENNPSEFMGLPHICEYREHSLFGPGWYAQGGEEDGPLFEYLNHECTAVAFFEWETYKEELE